MLSSESISGILNQVMDYLKELLDLKDTDFSVLTDLWNNLVTLIKNIMAEDI